MGLGGSHSTAVPSACDVKSSRVAQRGTGRSSQADRAHGPPAFRVQICAALSADSKVLTSNIVIVIGPTPPGTGVT